MRSPPCLCSLSVRMEVKCGICGVLDAEVSFDSCIVMVMLCCVYEMFELKYFYFFVFCFGGILFLSCVTVCEGVGGEELGWVVLGGASYGWLCDGNMWRVGTCRLFSVKSVGSECGGCWRG